MTTLRSITLIGSVMTLGLITGAFALYAHTVMPGLGRTDDRTFTQAYAAMDRAIVNPWFMMTGFLGALLFTAAAAVLGYGTPVFWWACAAAVLYLLAVIITVAVHLPLNDAMKLAVSTGDASPDTIRTAFDAARWEQWNYVRLAASAAAFGTMCWTLVLHGRATG